MSDAPLPGGVCRAKYLIANHAPPPAASPSRCTQPACTLWLAGVAFPPMPSVQITSSKSPTLISTFPLWIECASDSEKFSIGSVKVSRDRGGSRILFTCWRPQHRNARKQLVKGESLFLQLPGESSDEMVRKLAEMMSDTSIKVSEVKAFQSKLLQASAAPLLLRIPIPSPFHPRPTCVTPLPLSPLSAHVILSPTFWQPDSLSQSSFPLASRQIQMHLASAAPLLLRVPIPSPFHPRPACVTSTPLSSRSPSLSFSHLSLTPQSARPPTVKRLFLCPNWCTPVRSGGKPSSASGRRSQWGG